MVSKNTGAPKQLEPSEARETLLARARSKIFDPIDPERIVDHVLAVVDPAGGWPVQRDALEALIQRMAFARRDSLRVIMRPAGKHTLGVYGVRRPNESSLPHRALLRSVDPIVASCDCRDFVRNSLGLCKHILTVLVDLAARPLAWSLALEETPLPAVPPDGGLIWDPIRPLSGPGDWLQRVRWQDSRNPLGRTVHPDLIAEFDPRSGALRRTYKTRPAERLRLVHGLQRQLNSNQDPSPATDPALVSLLQGEHDRLVPTCQGLMTETQILKVLNSLAVPLFDYQKEAVGKFLHSGRLLLADDMGLGKTAQAIAASSVLFELQRVQRGLIVSPAGLKPQWQAEWSRFSHVPIDVVEGTPADRAMTYQRSDRGFLIANYEQLLRDSHLVDAWAPQLVVLDEAQRIKNWATKTALAVKRLRPLYRLALTGTPMENRLSELASIVEWIDDFALEPKWRLTPYHAITADGTARIIGVRGLDTIRERLSHCMVRRKRKDVIAQLPPRKDTVVTVSMTQQQAVLHDKITPKILQLLLISEKRPLTHAEFLRLMSLLASQRVIANGLAQRDFEEIRLQLHTQRPTDRALAKLSSPKLIEFRVLVKRLLEQSDRKIVVFSQWRRALELALWSIHDLIAERSERAVFFTGQEAKKRRTHNIVDFHDDPKTRIFLASDAGGTGLNLQRAANCVINFELPWNPAVLEQRIGRIYRLGQNKPIDVYHLITMDSIETRVEQIVHAKKSLFDGLFDEARDSVLFGSSGSFLEQLCEIYPKEERRPTAASKPKSLASGSAVPHEVAGATELFQGVTVHEHSDGSLTLSAASESAKTLVTVLQGMAQMLAQLGQDQPAIVPAPSEFLTQPVSGPGH